MKPSTNQEGYESINADWWQKSAATVRECLGCGGGVRKPVKAMRYIVERVEEYEAPEDSFFTRKLDGYWHKKCLQQKRFLTRKQAEKKLIATIP